MCSRRAIQRRIREEKRPFMKSKLPYSATNHGNAVDRRVAEKGGQGQEKPLHNLSGTSSHHVVMLFCKGYLQDSTLRTKSKERIKEKRK